MLRYPVYLIRLVLRLLGNLRRLTGRPPEYIHLTLEGDYPQFRTPPTGWLQRLLTADETSLQDLQHRFEMVAADPRVKGIILNLRQLTMPLTRLQALRSYMKTLRSAGKQVVIWSSGYDTAAYYLAAAGDQILLQPGGSIAPLGIERSFVYLADTLAWAGLEADFLQSTPYKSAPEMLMQSEMSDEVREMANWLLDAQYEDLLAAVAAGRFVTRQAAAAFIDDSPYTDLEARERGFVDALVSQEELAGHLGGAGRPVRLAGWDQGRRRLLLPPVTPPGKYVALIRIEGDIVDGRSRRGPGKPRIPLLLSNRAGDVTVVQAARRALADRRAAAVVLYIESGGGSATASEVMTAALEQLATRKPLVAVMGPVAGSGGYYVATPAKKIFAQPGTLTGSIGVVMGKIVSAGLMDRLRFHRHHISRGDNARLYDTARKFTDQERQRLGRHLDRFYRLFVDRVAAARHMTFASVDAVGGGRVWTGRQAVEHGLIDGLGGVNEALAEARKLAGLPAAARLREVVSGKQELAPLSLRQPSEWVDYPLSGVRALMSGRPLYLCPVVWYDPAGPL
ncbi:MAG: S49 family peptidase [Thermaerobacterales bacterium]